MSEPIPKKRGNPNMVPGGPSINPKGRPKLGHALSECVRARVDPEDLVGFLVRIVKEPGARMTDRMSAVRELLDRGWGKAIITSEIDATVNAANDLPVGFERFPPEERKRWLATVPLSTGGKS